MVYFMLLLLSYLCWLYDFGVVCMEDEGMSFEFGFDGCFEFEVVFGVYWFDVSLFLGLWVWIDFGVVVEDLVLVDILLFCVKEFFVWVIDESGVLIENVFVFVDM